LDEKVAKSSTEPEAPIGGSELALIVKVLSTEDVLEFMVTAVV
jgi:hypothetical protein